MTSDWVSSRRVNRSNVGLIQRSRSSPNTEGGSCQRSNYECRSGNGDGPRQRPMTEGLQKDAERKCHSPNNHPHPQQNLPTLTHMASLKTHSHTTHHHPNTNP